MTNQESRPECRICQNGIDPTHGKRMGRALIHCEYCGRDLTLAAILLAEAIINSTEETCKSK